MHLLSLKFHGLGLQTSLRWIFCSGTPKTAIKYGPGPGFYMRFRALFQTQLIVDRTHFFEGIQFMVVSFFKPSRKVLLYLVP